MSEPTADELRYRIRETSVASGCSFDRCHALISLPNAIRSDRSRWTVADTNTLGIRTERQVGLLDQDSEHTRVFVAGSDHVCRQRIVTVGPEVDDSVRVLNGLKVGEQVVTEGAIFLKREIESN